MSITLLFWILVALAVLSLVVGILKFYKKSKTVSDLVVDLLDRGSARSQSTNDLLGLHTGMTLPTDLITSTKDGLPAIYDICKNIGTELVVLQRKDLRGVYGQGKLIDGTELNNMIDQPLGAHELPTVIDVIFAKVHLGTAAETLSALLTDKLNRFFTDFTGFFDLDDGYQWPGKVNICALDKEQMTRLDLTSNSLNLRYHFSPDLKAGQATSALGYVKANNEQSAEENISLAEIGQGRAAPAQGPLPPKIPKMVMQQGQTYWVGPSAPCDLIMPGLTCDIGLEAARGDLNLNLIVSFFLDKMYDLGPLEFCPDLDAKPVTWFAVAECLDSKAQPGPALPKYVDNNQDSKTITISVTDRGRPEQTIGLRLDGARLDIHLGASIVEQQPLVARQHLATDDRAALINQLAIFMLEVIYAKARAVPYQPLAGGERKPEEELPVIGDERAVPNFWRLLVGDHLREILERQPSDWKAELERALADLVTKSPYLKAFELSQGIFVVGGVGKESLHDFQAMTLRQDNSGVFWPLDKDEVAFSCRRGRGVPGKEELIYGDAKLTIPNRDLEWWYNLRRKHYVSEESNQFWLGPLPMVYDFCLPGLSGEVIVRYFHMPPPFNQVGWEVINYTCHQIGLNDWSFDGKASKTLAPEERVEVPLGQRDELRLDMTSAGAPTGWKVHLFLRHQGVEYQKLDEVIRQGATLTLVGRSMPLRLAPHNPQEQHRSPGVPGNLKDVGEALRQYYKAQWGEELELWGLEHVYDQVYALARPCQGRAVMDLYNRSTNASMSLVYPDKNGLEMSAVLGPGQSTRALAAMGQPLLAQGLPAGVSTLTRAGGGGVKVSIHIFGPQLWQELGPASLDQCIRVRRLCQEQGVPWPADLASLVWADLFWQDPTPNAPAGAIFRALGRRTDGAEVHRLFNLSQNSLHLTAIGAGGGEMFSLPPNSVSGDLMADTFYDVDLLGTQRQLKLRFDHLPPVRRQVHDYYSVGWWDLTQNFNGVDRITNIDRQAFLLEHDDCVSKQINNFIDSDELRYLDRFMSPLSYLINFNQDGSHFELVAKTPGDLGQMGTLKNVFILIKKDQPPQLGTPGLPPLTVKNSKYLWLVCGLVFEIRQGLSYYDNPPAQPPQREVGSTVRPT